MNTYVILRRGWRTPEELEEAAGRSAKVGDEEMSTTCAGSARMSSRKAEAGRDRLHLPGDQPGRDPQHASRAMLPVDEIIPVADTVIVRPIRSRRPPVD